MHSDKHIFEAGQGLNPVASSRFVSSMTIKAESTSSGAFFSSCWEVICIDFPNKTWKVKPMAATLDTEPVSFYHVILNPFVSSYPFRFRSLNCDFNPKLGVN